MAQHPRPRGHGFQAGKRCGVVGGPGTRGHMIHVSTRSPTSEDPGTRVHGFLSPHKLFRFARGQLHQKCQISFLLIRVAG